MSISWGAALAQCAEGPSVATRNRKAGAPGTRGQRKACPEPTQGERGDKRQVVAELRGSRMLQCMLCVWSLQRASSPSHRPSKAKRILKLEIDTMTNMVQTRTIIIHNARTHIFQKPCIYSKPCKSVISVLKGTPMLSCPHAQMGSSRTCFDTKKQDS